MLERSAVKVASCVLMGERDREVSDLPDTGSVTPLYDPLTPGGGLWI